jgi:hypothetical protein
MILPFTLSGITHIWSVWTIAGDINIKCLNYNIVNCLNNFLHCKCSFPFRTDIEGDFFAIQRF